MACFFSCIFVTRNSSNWLEFVSRIKYIYIIYLCVYRRDFVYLYSFYIRPRYITCALYSTPYSYYYNICDTDIIILSCWSHQRIPRSPFLLLYYYVWYYTCTWSFTYLLTLFWKLKTFTNNLPILSCICYIYF